MSLISKQEDKLTETKATILHDLEKIEKSSAPSLEANIFIGKSGLRMLFENMLEAKAPICIIASKLQFKELFGPYFELWHKRRIQNCIHQKTILPLKLKSKVVRRKYLEYKFVNDCFTSPTTTIIYGNICVLIQWSASPIAIKIDNKEIASSHKNYFNLIWNS